MRKKREWFPGAYYHVMNRGKNHCKIFIDQDDYKYFHNLLKKTREKYPFIIHAYCLMSNHYHILLQTLEDEIWKIMKMIDQNYTQYFNHKYECDGSLFRGRYHEVGVKNDAYFLQTVKYILLNPVKAGIVRRGEDYQWSSGRTYLCKEAVDDEITYTDRVLSYFVEGSVMQFQQFMDEEEGSAPLTKNLLP